jgi:ribonuclease P protein component
MRESYGPRERVRKKKDFGELYRKGVCIRGNYFNLIYLQNNLSQSRMAAVASRKVGNAVERNRVRRRAKELFRRNKDKLMFPADLLLIAKKDFLGASWRQAREHYLDALRSIRARS